MTPSGGVAPVTTVAVGSDPSPEEGHLHRPALRWLLVISGAAFVILGIYGLVVTGG